MVSVAWGGTAERMISRILFKVLRAGSGTPSRYSSMFFGIFVFFMRQSSGNERDAFATDAPQARWVMIGVQHQAVNI